MWLPSAIRALRTSSNLTLGLVAALPYVFACLGIVLNSRHSDRTGERRWHVAVPCVAAGCALLLGATVGARSPLLAVILLCVTGFGIYASIGPMWALLTQVVPPASAGLALGLVNGLANLGGFFGPFIVGSLRDSTSGIYAGFLFLSTALVAAGLLTLAVNENGRTDQRIPDKSRGDELLARI